MKERIVIEVNAKDVSDYNDNHAIIFSKDEGKSKIEQVPESWEELKTMCERLEGQTMDVTCEIDKDHIDVTVWNIDRSYAVGEFRFYYDGYNVNLFINTGFSVDISIPKVWSFIKSLIGEE